MSNGCLKFVCCLKVDHVAISSQTQRKNKIKKETTNTKYSQINYKDNVKLCTLENKNDKKTKRLEKETHQQQQQNT